MSTFKLYDSTKKGTLILAGPRYGSHFLAKVVLDWLPVELRPEQYIGGHSELGITNERFHGVINELDFLKEQSGYQVAIVNDVSAKLWMIAHPESFSKDWHIVRIMYNDKCRWFISYWYFLIKNKLQFGHHGTDADVYKQDLAQHGPYTITPNDIMNVSSALTQVLMNQHIECDEHIDYQELQGLNTNVQWIGNQYLDIKMSELFTNAESVEKFLTNWPKETYSGKRTQ